MYLIKALITNFYNITLAVSNIHSINLISLRAEMYYDFLGVDLRSRKEKRQSRLCTATIMQLVIMNIVAYSLYYNKDEAETLKKVDFPTLPARIRSKKGFLQTGKAATKGVVRAIKERRIKVDNFAEEGILM